MKYFPNTWYKLLLREQSVLKSWRRWLLLVYWAESIYLHFHKPVRNLHIEHILLAEDRFAGLVSWSDLLSCSEKTKHSVQVVFLILLSWKILNLSKLKHLLTPHSKILKKLTRNFDNRLYFLPAGSKAKRAFRETVDFHEVLQPEWHFHSGQTPLFYLSICVTP